MGKFKDQLDALLFKARRDDLIPKTIIDDIQNRALYSIDEANDEQFWNRSIAIMFGIPTAVVSNVFAGIFAPPLLAGTIPATVALIQAIRSGNIDEIKKQVVESVRIQIDKLEKLSSRLQYSSYDQLVNARPREVGRLGAVHSRVEDVLPATVPFEGKEVEEKDVIRLTPRRKEEQRDARGGGGGPVEEEEVLPRREKVEFPPKKFGEK